MTTPQPVPPSGAGSPAGSGAGRPAARALGAPARPATVRQQLAQTALAAALSVPGVVEGNAGATRSVAEYVGDETLRGVRVSATGDDAERYVVDLQLTVQPVALPPLGEAIRTHVVRTARARGLGAVLGPVNVRFEDLALAGSAT